MTSASRRGWLPPTVTFGAFGLLGAAAALGLIGASDGTATSDRFVRSASWLSWVVLSGVALVVFAAMIVTSIRLLRQPEDWGIRVVRRRLLGYLVAAMTLVVLLVLVRLLSGGANPELPVTALQLRTGAVLLIGLIACIPWLAIVWLGHATCLELEPEQPADVDALVGRLRKLWQLVLTVVTAFAAVVVVAILCSGALRSAFLFAHPDSKDDFPPTNVLLYGALFAILLALITLPLVATWQLRARQLVDRLHPVPSEERTALEHRLHLDVSLVKNPLTALSVFTPLITSLLAAFIPQIVG